ncbi:hypothetical protein VTL71DRAFT_6568 [Oculimacula yallundae]|uniref:DUF7587 domain-containing protein n=1 Tax=Oculimacula yallundae TaxID=86028 RepID=A0ABR4BXE4_9HELO
MAEPWNIEHYKCTQPPVTLWRVVHSGTQSHISPRTKYHLASERTRKIENVSQLKVAIEDHIDWGSCQQSFFISVFSNKQHAIHWASRLQQRREPSNAYIKIYEIDTARLPLDSCLLDLDSLKNTLEIVHPNSTDEYLFLRYIPSMAIVGKWDLDTFVVQAEEDSERNVTANEMCDVDLIR